MLREQPGADRRLERLTMRRLLRPMTGAVNAPLRAGAETPLFAATPLEAEGCDLPTQRGAGVGLAEIRLDFTRCTSRAQSGQSVQRAPVISRGYSDPPEGESDAFSVEVGSPRSPSDWRR